MCEQRLTVIQPTPNIFGAGWFRNSSDQIALIQVRIIKENRPPQGLTVHRHTEEYVLSQMKTISPHNAQNSQKLFLMKAGDEEQRNFHTK